MLMHQLERPTETDSEGEDEVEIVKVVEGNVSEELEMKEVLEKTVFGGLLPKAARKLKPARKGLSVRTGRGGRNEVKQQQGVRDIAVLNHMLGNTADGHPPLSLYGHKSKKRKRGKRYNSYRTLGTFADSDDDHQGPSASKTNSTSTTGRQKVDKGEQEREEVLLGESSSGHSEASCQESTPQIWLPTTDIEQDQEGLQQKTSTKGPVRGGVNLLGKKKEILRGENKKT